MKKRKNITKMFAVTQLGGAGIILTLVVGSHLSYQGQQGKECTNVYDVRPSYLQDQGQPARGWQEVSLGIVASTTASGDSISDANIILMVPPTC